MKQFFIILLSILLANTRLLAYNLEMDSNKNTVQIFSCYEMGQHLLAINDNQKGNLLSYSTEKSENSLQKDLLTQPSAHLPESRLRRFETLFFISLPFTFVFSGLSVYLYAMTNEISFTTMNKSYSATVAASTVFLSTAVSIHGTFFSCSVAPETAQNPEIKKNGQSLGIAESNVWYFSWHKKIQ